MHSSHLLPALIFGVPIFGAILPANNIATVTATAHLEARKDDLITEIGPGCTYNGPSKGVPQICLATFPPYTPTNTKTANTPAITCYQQNEDPDQGILQQGCKCHQGTTSKTLPILSENGPYDSSCAYTDLASSTIAITHNYGPPYTNTQICQACTRTTDLGPLKCTSVPNCYPETPSATIQIGTSPVQVGTLTSAALFTSISAAVSQLCPSTATACDEMTKIKIPDIAYIEDDNLISDGELLVQVASSGYNDSSRLQSLIGMAAQSFASSATGKNCADVEHAVLEGRKRDHPVLEYEKINLCHAGHFASPQYYSQYWRKAAKPGPQDYLSVEITFGVGPGGHLVCEFVEALAELVETAFTPELLGPEQLADQEFGKSSNTASSPEINLPGVLTVDSAAIGCEEAMSLAGG